MDEHAYLGWLVKYSSLGGLHTVYKSSSRVEIYECVLMALWVVGTLRILVAANSTSKISKWFQYLDRVLNLISQAIIAVGSMAATSLY
jgi:hypothetical protein